MIDQDSQNPEDDSVNDSEIISYHKIIFIGNLLVGKSAIISVICGISFINETTMNVDFITKNIKFCYVRLVDFPATMINNNHINRISGGLL